jgi:S1-C subfamily serine protease
MIRVPVLAAVLALVLAGCGLGGDDDDGGGADRSTTRVEVIRSLGDGDGFDPQQIYKQEAPGVVTVVSLFGSDALEDLDDASAGVGSGFVLNGEGEIATNAHVVTTGQVPDLRKARTVYVEFADGNQVEAEVRGYDPESDIALLKVDPEGLTLRPLPLGESAAVAVGTPVAAIGSPFSERQSLSVGVVSAVDRSITGLTAFQIAGAIQTDAAINPGNSGGPLLDRQARVIGVNSQIETGGAGRGNVGVGFAVPSNTVRSVTAQLEADGRVRRAYLGVSTGAAPAGGGARVRSVVPGGPAARVGLRAGDVIVRIGPEAVRTASDVSEAVFEARPGQTVQLQYRRGGRTRTAGVRLARRPAQAAEGPSVP